MAFRRQNLAQAFRNNLQLQQFVLPNVSPTGRILGTGSFGSVEEVTYKHLPCAGKKLHEALIEAGNEGVAEVVRKYLQECQLMSNLRHPNITQFLGLCFLPGTRLPVLVMELLETSLDDLLEHVPNLPLSLKRSVLEDVASGLLYLHDGQPAVIHRDLTAKNVLLTSSLVAKITDMGNSRIVDMRPGQLSRTLSKVPGTFVYMPPEALDDRHRYGPSLDIFSFGHLALFTIIQKFPGDLLPSTFCNPDNVEDIRGRSEVQRREVYIELLEGQILSNHPALVGLVKQCLHNAPRERPSAEEVLARLRRMRVEVEGEYGGRPMNVDIMVRVRMAKEMKEKDTRIEELTEQQERQEAELALKTQEAENKEREAEDLRREIEGMRRQVEGVGREMEGMRRELEARTRQAENKEREAEDMRREVEGMGRQVEGMGREMEGMRRELKARTRQVEELQESIETKDREIVMKVDQIKQLQTTVDEFQSREVQLQATCRPDEELKKYPTTAKVHVPLKAPLKFNWSRGPPMPFGMSAHVQSVLIQETVYIGGGHADNNNAYIVMAYNTATKEWGQLSPYRSHSFGMTKINNQLVLVGGREGYSCSNLLGVWGANLWSHPYPDMPTARLQCSAVAYNNYVIVTGGQHTYATSTVEVLNTETKQWHTAPPTPVPWSRMKTAVIDDVCYFLGGITEKYAVTNVVYSVSFPALISKLDSTEARWIWKKMTDLSLYSSSPVSISGSLLVVGGIKHDEESAIHLYQADTMEWVKVGDLPSPRCNCTCIATSDKEVLVAGGFRGDSYNLSILDVAQIQQN